MKLIGTISGSGSNQEVIDAVTPPSPTLLTLGAVVASILANVTAPQHIVVDLLGGTVKHAAAGTFGTTGGGNAKLITFSPTGNTSKSLTDWLVGASSYPGDLTLPAVTRTDGATPLGKMVNEAFAPAIPSFSLAQFVDAMDRQYQTQVFDPVLAGLMILIDQTAGTVEVRSSDESAFVLTGTAINTFTRTIEGPEGIIWGE